MSTYGTRFGFTVGVLGCMLLGVARAPAQMKEWDRRFGGTGHELLADIALTPDGGYVLAGSTDSGISGDVTEASRGGYDYWVVKLDSFGAKDNDKRFGGSAADILTGMTYWPIQTAPPYYFSLLGHSESGATGDKSQNSRGLQDLWGMTVAWNSGGWFMVINRQYRFGGATDEWGASVSRSALGGVVNPPGRLVSSGATDSAAGGDVSQAGRGSFDYWMVDANDTGSTKYFDKRFGGSGLDQLTHMEAVPGNGGYLLAGYSNSGVSGDKTQASRGGYDYWVVRTDANGNKVWDRRFGGSGNDYLQIARYTPDGGFILGGTSYSGHSGDKTHSTRGGADFWVVKIDANGNKMWDRAFGGSADDELFDLILTTDGGYLLGGSSASGIGGDRTQSLRGVRDYWIVKIDANGTWKWDRRFGGTNADDLLALKQTPDGGFILAGHSYSGAGGDKSQSSRGNRDFWIVKLSPSSTAIYRFYSPVSGSHFYTRNEAEKDHIIANLSHAWNYEGTSWHAFATQAANTTPVYRFYSPLSGSHFYTRNEAEKNNIIANLSHAWNYEGIAWYAYATLAANTTPVYRFYSPVSGSHFYTRNQAERDHIIANLSHAWSYEGISYYAFAAPAGSSLGSPEVGDAMAAPGPAAPDFTALAASALTGVGPVNVVGDEAAGGVFFPLTMDDTFVTAAVYDPAAAAWDQVLPVTWAPGGITCANLRRGQPYWLAVLAHEAETETWVFEHGSWFGRRTAPAADVAVLDEAPTALGLPIETIRLPEADAPLTLQLYCPIEERNVLTATGLESGSAYDLIVPAWNRQYRLDVFDAHGEVVLASWLGHLRTH